MKIFKLLLMLAIVFVGWNCAGENKSEEKEITIQEKIAKSIPHYKLAYSNQFGCFCSFRFSFDTIHNIIQTVADSLDVLTRDQDIYRKFYDSTYQMNYAENPFTHYYIHKYCLKKDTFELCSQTATDTFPLPLIFELRQKISSAYSSPKSFNVYPTDACGDTSETIPESHRYNAVQLAEISALANKTGISILADQSVDLNYDSIPERLVAFRTDDGLTTYAILEKENRSWKMIDLYEMGFGEIVSFKTIQLAGRKNRSIVLKVFSRGYVPRERYFEDVLLFLPSE